MFLKDLLTNKNIEVSNYLKNGSRLLGYQFNRNKIFDLINYTGCSLKDACKSYKLHENKTKKEFEHSLLKSWSDVEKYKNEILPYLKYDLISMYELTKIFNNEMYSINKKKYI